jgi:hypothetical protein
MLTHTIFSEAAEVEIKKHEDGASVFIGGELFARYRTKSGHQPIVWPIIGPNGQQMTRQYPMDSTIAGERKDHPHHRSLWFSHGQVNGLDFWMPPGSGGPAGKDNQIIHRTFKSLEAKNGVAKLVSENDWISEGTKICEDTRTVLFGADEHGRWIDFAADIRADESDVVFGDTEEGAFAVRVPTSMDVDSKKGGEIVNSNGQKNVGAWGRAAKWVDYHGPVAGKTAGITIFCMPDNFRNPCRWHVRPYGLFAANPFGARDFPKDDGIKQGEVTIRAGESLAIHYRVLFYSGPFSAARTAEIYENYTRAAN